MKDRGMEAFALALLALALVTFEAPKTYGQFTGSAVIQGTVMDPSGAVIPNATVTATNVATGVKSTAATTSAGFYVISPVPPGQYTLTVTAQGFKTAVQEHVTATNITLVEVNFTMQMGSTTQEVIVTGAPPALSTSDASLGGAVTQEVYSSLPLNFSSTSLPGAQGPRDPEGFIYLLPGVVNPTGFNGNINGGGLLSKQNYVNGLPFNNGEVDAESRMLTIGVSLDSIDQFKLISNGIPPQYQGQGVENFTTKSGTNKFHGSAYDYARNTVFDSRGFFAAKTPIENQSEFGGTAGGPVKKDKIFFFGNYEGYRLRLGTVPHEQNLPTPKERAGDFSELPVPIYDPATTVCNGGVCTRQQFPGNIIPTNRISGISSSLQSALPAVQNSGLQNNYLGQYSNGKNAWNYGARMDFNVSDKQRIFVYQDQGFITTVGFTQSQPGANVLPLPYTSARPDIEGANATQFSHTYVFSPALLNQVAFEYTRYTADFGMFSLGGNYLQKAGLKGIPPFSGFPDIIFSGPNSPTYWGGPGSTSYYAGNNYTFQDNAQWVRGRHSVSFGTQLQWHRENRNQGNYFDTFNFNSLTTAGYDSTGSIISTTGNAYASYLLGQPSSGNVYWNPAAWVQQRMPSYSFYVNDNWKTTQRLTLNLGLRWQYYSPFVERYDRGSFFNPAMPNPAADGHPGAVQFFGYGQDSCNCRTPVHPYYRNFQPRAGLAYKINDKTVFRAGFGMYSSPAGSLDGNSTDVPLLGYSASPTFSSPDGGITPAFNWNNGFPAFTPPPFFDPTLNTGFTTAIPGSRGGVTFMDPQLGGKPSYYLGWNVAVQREISPSTTITVAYAGGDGHRLVTGVGNGIYTNQIDPKYLALGNLLQQAATPTTIAAAQAIFPSIRLPYANFAGSIGQMLLPFPQYGGINDVDTRIGNSTYNSLQIQAERKFARGLQFMISYTWAKELDDAGSQLGGFFGANARTAYNTKLEKSVGALDVPSALVTSFVYQLPFGSGHSLASSNPVSRALLSNWQFTGILTYESGTIDWYAGNMGPFSGGGFAPYTGGTYADYAPGFTGPVRINGAWGSGPNPTQTPYINVKAFKSPAPFTLGNIPRTLAYGLRNPQLYNEDFSLRREIPIKERLRIQIEVMAFNTFNRTQFAGIGTDITSASFGTVSTQGNTPRQFEFSGKLVW